MIRINRIWSAIGLLVLCACSPGFQTFKFGDRSLRIPEEYIQTDVMSLSDMPGYDKKGNTVWLKAATENIKNNAGNPILQGYEKQPVYYFQFTPIAQNRIPYIVPTAEQKTEEYRQNVDEGEDIVFDVAMVGKVGDNMRPTLILDKANNIQSVCQFGFETPKKVTCSNYVFDNGIFIEYTVPLEFMLDADRDRALEEYFRGLLRKWEVKP